MLQILLQGEGKPSYIKDTVKLDSVTVKSDHSAEERVTAKAGSAGGISVSPVLALNISGMRSEAYIGNADLENGSQWQIRNDLTVSSDSVIRSSGCSRCGSSRRVSRHRSCSGDHCL